MCTYTVNLLLSAVETIQFSWDEPKARSNQRKHGISFEEAKTAFSDERALLIADPEHSREEDRFILLGMSVTLRLLVVCHCYREDEHHIRIISARKATRNETRFYAKGVRP